MSKLKTEYICKDCGYKSLKLIGKCPNCGSWESFEESQSKNISSNRNDNQRQYSKPILLSEAPQAENTIFKTQFKEFNRVLGGGVVSGSFVLLGGDPGIGKSTLLIQACSQLQDINKIYITGEESLPQIRMRAERLEGVSLELQVMAETNLEAIISTLSSSNFEFAVIDSIQSVYSELVDAPPGSPSQIRECAQALMKLAKQKNIAIFIVGHITKDGAIAGPKMLEHMVDTVLQFEGEKNYDFRLVRCLKNRFGSTNEIGVFEMTGNGLIENANPSSIFLSENKIENSGIAITAAKEGSRVILHEVQALVTPSAYSVPQRISNGFDAKRLNMIVAVLEKRLGLNFFKQDIFVNIVGGVAIDDTAADLALAAALISSFTDTTIDFNTAFIGEIGLTGEVRNISAIEQRISEIEKLGFKSLVLPKLNDKITSKQFTLNLSQITKINELYGLIS